MSPRMGLDVDIILKNATELANQEGFDQVTLASLAKKLNIRPPSLYNHISGLQDLRKLMAIQGLNQLYNLLYEAVQEKNGRAAIMSIGEVYLQFARHNPGLYEATLRSPNPQDEGYQQAGSKIVELILTVLQIYQLNEDDAIHIVRGLRSIIHGLASLEGQGAFAIPLEVNDTLELVLETFIAGIEKRTKDDY